MYPPEDGAVAHEKAQRLRTHGLYHNDPPIKRTALFEAGLLVVQLACQMMARAFACRCDIVFCTDRWDCGQR